MSWDRSSFESLDADGIDIGSNAFVDTGDDFSLAYVGGDNGSASTTSSTYSTVLIEWRMQWDTIVPANVTPQVVMNGFGENGGGQIDIRVRNITDGETVVENTAAAGSNSVTATYTPTTTTSAIRLAYQIRNGDNATSVTINEPGIGLGVPV